MAGAGTSLPSPPRLCGLSKSTAVKFIRPNFTTGAPFTFRISTTSHRHRHRHPHVLSTCSNPDTPCPLVSEGPSCIFVGPIETASQETLEALYRQARDAYYSGTPLIVDDMFDRVELKLRWYGSKYVVKYPRCSLRRQSTYADAQEDPSQVFALASIWFLIFVLGGSVCLVPILYTIFLAYHDSFNSEAVYISQSPTMESLAMLHCVIFMLLGSAIGCPIASASVRQLQGLWRHDLVALKGACPNCGEEVFAFVKPDQSNNSSPHRADCHVCDCLLEFRTKAEQSITKVGRRWVHGRVYLISERRGSWRKIQT